MLKYFVFCFLVLESATALDETCVTDIGMVLEFNIYQNSCPDAESIIFSQVQNAISQDPRMAASLLRLHFHDCFVNASNRIVFN